jgi:hypothetical protein
MKISSGITTRDSMTVMLRNTGKIGSIRIAEEKKEKFID